MDTPPTHVDTAHRQPPQIPPDLKGFRAAILIALTVAILASFVWLGTTIVRLVEAESLAQARSYTDLIIAARAWNAQAGGVYVRKTDTVTTNPYLVILGIDPDVELVDGTVLTLRNPATMTREIGEQLPLAGSGSDFKLTSLDPVNPANTPDEWERSGLEQFEEAADEYWAVDTDDEGERRFRYMRALYVEKSCLTCHASSGYKVGDIRGAMSIRLPYESTARALLAARAQLITIAATILIGLWAFVLLASRILATRLSESNRQLALVANTDALTGLWNRGYAMDRLGRELDRARRREQSVGVLLLDIDHFKQVNDTFGHAAGDAALRQVARILDDTVRTYDVVSRIGGEELLIVAPDIDPAALSALAERVRTVIASAEITGLEGLQITASIGTAYADSGADGETVDSLIARADAAMYAAKDAGRNRVVAG